MQAIEEHFRMANRYELFTGHRSARNLYFYRGYRVLTHSSTDCKMPIRLSKDDSLSRICHVILLTIYFSGGGV